MPLGGLFGKRGGGGESSSGRGHVRHQSSPKAEPFVFEAPSTPRQTRNRARTLLSSPRTPLSRIFTSFGGKGSESWCRKTKEVIPEITRPGSASSSYSSSSDDSFESMLTQTTDCTIPENDNPSPVEHMDKLGPAFNDSPEYSHSNCRGTTQKRKNPDGEGFGAHDSEWSMEMDAHLWKTYTLYQSDPTVTPFCVVPGGVPPLGVCMRVARVAKNTWREARSETRGKSPMPMPMPRGVRVRTPGASTKGTRAEPRTPVGNKADLMRRASANKWSASESATRKRLRILCRRGYGPSANPYHNHRTNPTEIYSRHRKSHLYPILDDEPERRPLGNALLTSTRSMALSLVTSTSVSPAPSSTSVAHLGPSQVSPNIPGNVNQEEVAPTLHNTDPSPEFDGLTDANGNVPPVAEVLASVGFRQLSGSLAEAPSSSTFQTLRPRRPRANTTLSSSIEPLAAFSSLPATTNYDIFGEWLRRQQQNADNANGRGQAEEFGGPLPALPDGFGAPRRSIGGLFEDIAAADPRPAPQTPRTRQRGYTVNVGPSGNVIGRRRPRSSPIALTLPAWVYETSDGASSRPNLAQILGVQSLSNAAVPNLGPPFEEERRGKGKGRAAREPEEEFGPPLPKKGTFVSGAVIGESSRQDAESSRPVKRLRE